MIPDIFEVHNSHSSVPRPFARRAGFRLKPQFASGFFLRMADSIPIESPIGHAHQVEAGSRVNAAVVPVWHRAESCSGQTKTASRPGAHPHARLSGSAPNQFQGHERSENRARRANPFARLGLSVLCLVMN